MEPLKRLEVLLNEREDDSFVFRRDTRVSLSIARAFVTSMRDIPILAPEIVLLYKSNHPPELQEQADFMNVLPALEYEQRRWLSKSIATTTPTHGWLSLLTEYG